ncbi:hypothetical protein ISN44_As08g033820 [Arabidopsis suecica]|uniref:Uncharacterized protein n=1 Tax=Arabidopsis suecica TaxID=45249 RepID=A0A8T2BAT9_ARASU|nr:hypothetical protein ISN44_As08g033820 [Arabidopsis suecica]
MWNQSHYPPPGYPSAPPPPGYSSPPSHHEGYPPPQPHGGYQLYPPPSLRPYEGGYQGYFARGGYPHHHHGPPPPPPPQNYNHCHHDHHHNHGSDSGCFSFIRGWFVFSTTSRLLIYFYQCFRLLSLLCVQ